MKLFLLKRNFPVRYDENDGFVIRAENEFDARCIANENHADEGRIWDCEASVSCQEININGNKGIILADFYEA